MIADQFSLQEAKVRPVFLLAAIPFALGCAQQSVMRTPVLPSAEQLHVRLFPPTGGALTYEVSEPAYVAIFAVSRGPRISMVFPYFRSQIDLRSHAGINQQMLRRPTAPWGHSVSSGNESRMLRGQSASYYVIASKYPLPVEEMLSSISLRNLLTADLSRAMKLRDLWDALEARLVEGLPDDAWASDVYLWGDPFMTL